MSRGGLERPQKRLRARRLERRICTVEDEMSALQAWITQLTSKVSGLVVIRILIYRYRDTILREVIYCASSLFFETLQQAWEWATEQRELHPRSGIVADCTNGAVAWSARPGVEARERRRRRTRRGSGKDALASPARDLI
ncbi:hypothetical protein NDU88_007565 [Pleurodeles waltl]|uniref:Uncharacterized protein n=1 Tax=Pleurodeles waltl TaxID=8319 RepID=A0AAV7QL47_PLEWA|nr:hypothetical protein NDU88_007565 [Pleurodeles waltl]